jgi:undecaprenyl-diphosphatase
MLDLIIVNFLYDAVRSSALLSRVVIDMAIYAPWLLGGVALLYILQKRSLRMLYTFSITFLGSWILAEVLKHIIGRSRPYVLFTRIKPLFLAGDVLAMPSVHAVVLSCVAVFIFTFDRRIGIFLWIGAFFIGLARVAAGVHWPSDVLIGLILGTFIGLWPLLLPKMRPFLKDLLIKAKSL